MSVPITHLTADARAQLDAENARRREALRHRRDLAERFASDFRVNLTDEQLRELALFEARARAGGLRRLPSIFGSLE